MKPSQLLEDFNVKDLVWITTCIALFFFTKWVWKTVPHYEMREYIATDVYCHSLGITIGKLCSGDSLRGERNDWDFVEVEQFYCDKETMFEGMFKGTCYIKEKVRK